VLYRCIITKCACCFPEIIDTLPKPNYVPSVQLPLTFFKSPTPSPCHHPSTYSHGPSSFQYLDTCSCSHSPPILFMCTHIVPPHLPCRSNPHHSHSHRPCPQLPILSLNHCLPCPQLPVSCQHHFHIQSCYTAAGVIFSCDVNALLIL